MIGATTRSTTYRIVVLSLSALLTACGDKADKKEASTEPTRARDPLAVTVQPELMKQIQIGKTKLANVAGSLRINGRVEADETRIARVSSSVAGRLTDLEVVEGQTVKRGQVVATLRSTGLTDAQFAFVKSASQQQLAERAAERAKLLLDADVIGSAEVQRRQAELLQATAEKSSLRSQLLLLGMAEDAVSALEKTRTVNSVSQVVASISGTVLQRMVTPGQVVQPAEIMFVIADLSNVWLVADVPEQNAAAVVVGKSVQAEIPALPGLRLSGVVSFVSDIVNPETSTIRVRMNLPNAGRKFKPAMLATMIIADSSVQQRVVPATAVVRQDDEDYVFVQTSPQRFVLRKVELGDELENTRVLLSGIEPGDTIVMDGAFHLNNERQRLALQGGN
jgi:cobalt-zinc-cadmium efflux system membrane fusion protein